MDANELFRIHQAFVSTLEKLLANELWQIYQQLQQQDSLGNIEPIHTLLSAGIVRGISFCRDQLVSEMADALYSAKENMAKAKSGFLRLYLIATDAWVQYYEDGPRDTSITIRVRCDPLSLRTHPVVDAAWVPDSLTFEGLDEFPLEGQSFSIIPRYHSKSAFRLAHFPKNVKYSIESESWDSLWLVWDNEIAGFKGIVPFYSEVNGYDHHRTSTCRGPYKGISDTLKVIVQAVLVDDNGSSIRYERILRARLTLKVVPWYANKNSRETKEPLSVLKGSQDTRLASAAQPFALQGPRVSPLKPGQSSYRPSQRSQGAHPYKPIESAYTGQVRFTDNHPAMNSPATGAGLKETDLTSLAQTQAHLVAKCAELNRELEKVKEQVTVSGLFGDHHDRTLHVPDPQEYLNDNYRVTSYHHTGYSGPTIGSSDLCVLRYASEHSTTPSSPSLNRRNATFQLEPNARFSVLSPPAIGQTARPTSYSQTSNGGNDLNATRAGRDPTLGPSTSSQLAAREEGLMTQDTLSAQESGYFGRFPGKVTASSSCIGTVCSFPRQRLQKLRTPPMGEQTTLSISGKRGRKGRTGSSLNLKKRSPSKLSRETGKQPKQEIGAQSAEPGTNMRPPLDSEDEESSSPTQWSRGIFYNSFGPLRDLRSSTSLAGEDAPALHSPEREASTDSSENIKHRNQDSNCYLGTEQTYSDESGNETSPVSSGLGDGTTAAEGLPSNSFFPNWKGQVCVRKSSSASFSPRDPSASSIGGSRSTSSDMEFIVEQDLRARKVSRREQAKLWALLSQSDSDKGNRPEPESQEVRLSEDEKKAMDEAMRRSLDDLAGGFDDIFLEDSSQSNSDDDL